MITIPNAESLNHVVIFLTGVAPVPPGMACCLFFSMPDPMSPPNWNYLGCLVNEKPSAIFKLSNLTKSNQSIIHTPNNETCLIDPATGPVFNYIQAPVINLAQIGISIEPLESVIQMVPAVETTASNMNSFSSFMNKTVENLYNYCASFARPVNEIFSSGEAPTLQFVPLSVIQTWYENYTRRLSNDGNFWKALN